MPKKHVRPSAGTRRTPVVERASYDLVSPRVGATGSAHPTPRSTSQEYEVMPPIRIDWNKVFEFTWRILVFIVAIAIIVVVTGNWNRWEGRQGWQSTDDAYLQSDLTPIAAKVTGYVRTLPVQDFERVRAGQVLAEIVDDDYRAAVGQLTAAVAAASAQVETLKAQRLLQAANIQSAKAVIEA